MTEIERNNTSEGFTLSEASEPGTTDFRPTSDFVDKTNIPIRTLNKWTREGLIPSQSTGSGTQTRYQILESDLLAFMRTKQAGKYQIKDAQVDEPTTHSNLEEKAPLAECNVTETPQARQTPTEGKEPKSVIVKIEIKKIQFEPDCQIREQVDEAVACEYAGIMKSGFVFPPVDAFIDQKSGDYYIGDGYHRIAAAKGNKDTHIEAIVNPGGKTAAIKCALKANAAHGIRRSSADKRRSISIALRHYPKLSNVEIAKICAVSESSVRNHRKDSDGSEKRIGSDGKKQAAHKKLPLPYKRAKSAITRMRCTKEDAAKLIDWLKMHYKLKEPESPKNAA